MEIYWVLFVSSHNIVILRGLFWWHRHIKKINFISYVVKDLWPWVVLYFLTGIIPSDFCYFRYNYSWILHKLALSINTWQEKAVMTWKLQQKLEMKHSEKAKFVFNASRVTWIYHPSKCKLKFTSICSSRHWCKIFNHIHV